MEKTNDVKVLKIIYFLIYICYEYIIYSIASGYIGDSNIVFIYLFFLQAIFLIATYFINMLLGKNYKSKILILLFFSLIISFYSYVINTNITYISNFSFVLVCKSIFILIFYYIK